MWNTLSNAHTKEAWSNHWLLILRKLRPLSLPSNATDRAFFKLLSDGRPGAPHLDISIKHGLCGSVSAQARWVPRGRRNMVTWAGGGGEAAWGKGPEEFCYSEEKRLVTSLFSGGRFLPHNRSSTLWLHTPLCLPHPFLLLYGLPAPLRWWLL